MKSASEKASDIRANPETIANLNKTVARLLEEVERIAAMLGAQRYDWDA